MDDRKKPDRFPREPNLAIRKGMAKKTPLAVVVNLCVCGLCEHWKKHLHAPDSIHDQTLGVWS